MLYESEQSGDYQIAADLWLKWLELARRYDHNQAVRGAIKRFKPAGKRKPNRDRDLFAKSTEGKDQ